VQFNSDHKSSNANLGLPVYLILLLLLLRVDLLKYSRSLYEDALLNIKVVHDDPVLLYYLNTEQHHGTQDVYTEYLVLVCSIETM